MPDFPTCATRFEAISKELAESHTVAANHHKVLQERFLIAFGPAAPTQPRGRPKKEEEGKGRDDSLYRLNVARNGYRAALQISSSFFLVFAMSFAKSNSTKAAVDLLEKVATKRHFSLDNDTMTCFTTWAKEREYDSDEAFVKFYDGLQRIVDGSTAPAKLSAYKTVETIIKDKGLEGNSQVLDVIRTLFPEYAHIVDEAGEKGQQREMGTRMKEQREAGTQTEDEQQAQQIQ